MPPKKSKSSTKEASSSKKASTSTNRRESLRSSKRQQREESPPDAVPWGFLNEEDERNFRSSFGKRILLPSKYIDESSLEHLELLAEVEQLISSIGWRSFMNKKWDSYYEITREVMCTFSTNANQWHDAMDQVISFQCMGVMRKLSLGEVRTIMGFPEADKWFTSSFDVHKAWYEMTGQPKWKHSLAKSTYIQNPALRYIHRVLSHTIFGRGDSMGSVTMAEVFVLWCMTNCGHLDGSLFLIRHLATVAGNASGIVRVGGIITAWAEHFGFNPTDAPVCTKMQGKQRIDLATMENMQMIRKQGNQYYLIGLDGLLVPKRLPHDLPHEETQVG